MKSISKVKRYSNDHEIKLFLPEEIILINIDGLLIEQVLVNLIQNGVRYTQKGCEIQVIIEKEYDNPISKFIIIIAIIKIFNNMRREKIEYRF